jgi:phosphatidylinositol 4-kinase
MSGSVADQILAAVLNGDSILSRSYADTVREMETALAGLELRSTRDKRIPIDIPRNILRRAAALLCSGREVQPSIVSHLVNIPFQLFTIESINMGISLWLGVIHENPKTGSRMLVEVAQAWERTIHRKQGIFNPSFK